MHHAADRALSLQGIQEYLFWDGIHPTSAAHAIVAQQVAETLP